MTLFISEIVAVFSENSDADKAKDQERYMKNHFQFYGITSPNRKKLQAPFLIKKYLPPKKEAFAIVKELWQKPQRELHYFSMELLNKYKKQVEKEDIKFFEWLITTNSWWDTVDFIAANLVGHYFQKYPEMRTTILSKWLKSENIWLQRTCLIFQLKYKENTETQILSECIEQLIGSKEFFINKAIGWSLRQYSRENPVWVEDFVYNHPKLANLSKREALRLIK